MQISKLSFALIFTVITSFSSYAVGIKNDDSYSQIQDVNVVSDDFAKIPCPNYFTVEINSAVDNSLTYTHESNLISINVSYIPEYISKNANAESFSRVSAELLKCELPIKSDLIKGAWSFKCDEDVEAIVYGDTGDLVLLSISGRNSSTEEYLENFIRFLSYHSKS